MVSCRSTKDEQLGKVQPVGLDESGKECSLYPVQQMHARENRGNITQVVQM